MGNRELPMILGQLPILKKPIGMLRGSLAETSLDIPPVSGAYEIAKLDTGRAITYQRRADYWAKDLNVNIGKNNIDRVTYVYFGDDTVAFEALKAGEIDFRREFSSRVWATGYDTPPAVKSGTMVRETVTLENSAGMQGFVFNLRRPRFNNIHVREALIGLMILNGPKRTCFTANMPVPVRFFRARNYRHAARHRLVNWPC